MKPYRTLLVWGVVILIFFSMYQVFVGSSSESKEISFSKFMEDALKGNITKVLIKGRRYEFSYHQQDKKYHAVGIVDEKIDQILRSKKIEVTYKHQEQNSFWQQVVISWLPILFLVVVFVFFMRQLQSGGGRAMSFGKSRAKLLNDNHHKVTFNDVAGIEEAKEELQEIVHFLKDPKKFTRLGGRIPKGVLLMGAPGTGKTLLGRAVAGEAGVPFFSISGSDFVEMFVGVGASRVRDLFEQGKRNAPCIIFIDEIDAVGRHRGAGLGGGHDEREQTLNQLLVEMDGFESNDGVILIAATNRPDVLDPALQRPGRFDRRVVVPLPDVGGREKILRVHTKRTPLSSDVKLSVIARGTPGFSGADLENLVNEAALTAAKDDQDHLYMRHFEESKDKVIMGRERRSMILSEKEKYRTAVHEIGHAIVGLLLPHTDPVHKVTVIPRGRALGVTMTLPVEDRKDISKEFVENSIAFAMGGRAADELIFGQQTAGASNDISKATGMARKMVCEWGMSDRLGPLAFGKKQEQIFLGREISQSRDYSEATAVAIDEEIHRIVNENHKVALEILSKHLDAVKKASDYLLEHETISGDEVMQFLKSDDDTSGSKEKEESVSSEKASEKAEVSDTSNDDSSALSEAALEWESEELFEGSESKKEDSESKKEESEPKKEDSESKKEESESKKEDSESKKEDSESKKEDSEPKKEDSESKKEDSESKKEDSESKKEDSESKKEDSESKKEDSESKKEDSE